MNPKTNFFQSVRSAHPGLVATLVLGVLILGTFGWSRDYAMLKLDSVTYILEDRAIQVLDWEHLWRVLTTYYYVNYNPLHRISYMVDLALWGPDPGCLRATNFLLHWGATVFAYLSWNRFTNKPLAVWLAVLVFALHPTRIECVVWLSQRKDVLSAVFGFAAFWAYLKAQPDHAGPSDHVVGSTLSPRNAPTFLFWYGISLGLYICALASKAQWVSLAAVLVLTDLARRNPMNRVRMWSYVPFFAVSLLFAWLAVDAQLIEGKQGTSPSLWVYLTGPFTDLAVYAWNTLLPVQLYLRVPRFGRPNPQWWVVAGGVIFFVMTVWAMVRSWQAQRVWFFGWGWFYLFLLPMLNLLPGLLEPSDRYLYVAILGPFYSLGVWFSRFSWQKQMLTTTGLSCFWLAATLWYLPVWKNDLSLWTYTVKFDPTNILVVAQLAMAQTDAGTFPQAHQTIELALRMQGQHPLLYQTAMMLAQKEGTSPETFFQRALAATPHSISLKLQYCSWLLDQKRVAEAETLLHATPIPERLGASFLAKATYQSVRIAEERGNLASGLSDVKKLLAQDPYHDRYWLMLGRLYESMGNKPAAEEAYRAAARLNEKLIEPRYRLALSEFQRQRLAEAETWLLTARTSLGAQIPAPALNLLAAIYRQTKRPRQALAAAGEAVQADPKPQYVMNLMRLQLAAGNDPQPFLRGLLNRNPELHLEISRDPQLARFLP
ncbi:MAG: hypothetical protein K1Y36_19305 [Blastocatellia bacterium]|nr:hypothetical protein [Blastocatellia bacterium]